MADTEIGASLKLNADQANQSMGTFKKQLKEANELLLAMQKQFGETSPQALAAAKSVAQLKDQIKGAKEVSDLFDPGAKFQAFGNVVRGVTGGITGLTGALALFGGESKNVEKALLKVQGALALTEGLNTLADAAKDYKRLNALIQQSAAFQAANALATKLAAGAMKLFGVSVNQTSTAFKVLKGAIAATGIGLLIIAVSTLISKISEWTSGTNEAEKAQRALNIALEAQQELLRSELKGLEFSQRARIARAKIAGQTEKELKDIEEEIANERVETLRKNFERLNEIAKDEQQVRARSAEDQERANKEALDAFRTYNNALVEQDFKTLENRAIIAEKTREKEKQAADKAQAEGKAAAEKRRDAEKAAIEQLENLRQENFLSTIENERKRQVAEADLAFDNEKKKVESLLISEEKKAQIIEQLNIQRANKIAEIDKKIAKEQGEREKEALDNLTKIREENLLAAIQDETDRAKKKAEIDFANAQLEIDNLKISEELKTQLIAELKIKRQQTLDEIDAGVKEKQDELKMELDEMELEEFELKLLKLDEWYQQKLKIVKGNEELELQLKQSYESQKTELERISAEQRLTIVSGILGKAADLFGKQTAAGKALAIAEATINTYTGATLALREKSTLPQPFSTIQKILSAGLIIAAGIKSVSQIAKTKVPGSGGGGSLPSIAPINAAAPLQPSPQVVTTQLDQDTLNATNNATVRAYMVESDVTDSQERITRLNRAARLTG